MAIKTLSPAETRATLDTGALLVDIRDADEHARQRIPGAVNLPLDRIGDLCADGRPVVFHCRSGMRTAANADRLVAAAGSVPAFVLAGGIDAWRRDGHAITNDRGRPMEMMRQVQITAGLLVLTGVVLGFVLTPAFFGLSAFAGAGLIFAGATGWCGMATLLRAMPWNRRLAV